MNEIYTDIVIDGELHSGSFHGVGLRVGKNALRAFIAYKAMYPKSYEEINKILFDREKGTGFSHLMIDLSLSRADEYIEDIKKINPDIEIEHSSRGCEKTTLNCPEFAVLADGNGLSGEGSVTSIAENFILSRPSVTYFDAEDVIDTDGVWAGEFFLSHIILALAHTTRFVQTGWDYADGNTSGDYMALSSGDGDYSIIFVNKTSQPKKYSVCIRCMGKADATVRCIETRSSDSGSRYSANWFRMADKILPFRKSYGYCYNVEVKPHSVMTCTTLDVPDVEQRLKQENYTLTLAALPLTPDPQNGVFPFFDVSGSFDPIVKDDKPRIIQTGLHGTDDCACTVFGSRLLSDYKLSADVVLSDNDSENFAGIGILCDRLGRFGYTLKIFPDGEFEVWGSRGQYARLHTELIADGENSLEISSMDGILSFKINGQNVYHTDITVVPSVVSGYACLVSAYKPNSFSGVSIDSVDKRVPYCIDSDCLCGSFTYSDNWVKNGFAGEEFANRTSVFADGSGQYFEFEFSGENVALFGRTKSLRAKIEIDGIITKAGEICGTDSNPNEVFYIERGLENTLHTMKLTVLSGELEFSGAWIYISGQQKTAVIKKSVKSDSDQQKSVRLSTLLAGAGLAAAGLGTFLIGRKIKNRKNKKLKK